MEDHLLRCDECGGGWGNAWGTCSRFSRILFVGVVVDDSTGDFLYGLVLLYELKISYNSDIDQLISFLKLRSGLFTCCYCDIYTRKVFFRDKYAKKQIDNPPHTP